MFKQKGRLVAYLQPKRPNNNKSWRPQPDLNRCCRRERPVSWTRLDDGDSLVLVGRARLERATLCLKGRYSTS